jgi:predicted RND superfamily exporter protein
MTSTRGFASTIRALERNGAELLGEGVSLRAAGYLPLYLRITDYVVVGTAWGLGLALLVVFALLALALRSVALTAAAVAVNLLPVLLVFGTMGWAGIPLDIATATIGAIVLGIAVDDSIHLLVRFRAERRRGRGPRRAMTRALRGAGRAVVLSSLVLGAGFGVLALCGSPSIAYFGVMGGLAIAGALLADLLLLPALLIPRRTARAGVPRPPLLAVRTPQEVGA